MRSPRFRFTLRRMMIAVAGLAVCMGLFRLNPVLGVTGSLVFAWIFWKASSEDQVYLVTLKLAIGYCVVGMVTIPFADAFWLGELPLLAIIQLPKVTFAGWLRTGIVMEAIKRFGLSRGSFSPDYLLARPYALAIAYLVPLAILIAVVGLRTRMTRPYGRLTLILLIAAVLDYVVFTLAYASARFLTIY